MKLLFQSILILLFVCDSTKYPIPSYSIFIEHEPSEIRSREDLKGRMEYLNLIYADPSTRKIPANIRATELQFERTISIQTKRIATQSLNLKSIGPANIGGRTRAVAFDIRDENIIIAGGVSGGIWKSVDRGATWIRKSNPENRNSITCIAQDTRQGREDTWYHGTGEFSGNSSRGGGAPFRGNGIYKSVDNGETWNPIPSTQNTNPNFFNSQFQYIWDIEINPNNLLNDEVLIAAYGGILRSLDGGNNWTVVLGQKLFDLSTSVDLNKRVVSSYTSLERSENNVFYAGLSTSSQLWNRNSPDAGIYYSLNGYSWKNITPFEENFLYRRIAIGSSISNPDITYFMINATDVMNITDSVLILQHTLSEINSPTTILGFDPKPRETPKFDEMFGFLDLQQSYNMMIRVHPNNPDMVFAGGTNLFRSTDGFKSQKNTKWIGGYDPEGGSKLYANHHPDQHDLLFLPSNPEVAVSASDGGLILSQDITANSVTWHSINDGFITSQFHTITQSKMMNDPTTLGGMQDNGTHISAGSTKWNPLIGGDGAYVATTNNNSLWFASFQRGQTIRLTLDDEFQITSFGRVDPRNLVDENKSNYLFINPFILDPTNQNRMFCAGGNRLYFHPNISQIPSGSQKPNRFGWKSVNKMSINNGLISTIDSSFDGEIVYYGTSRGQLFRLNNADNESQFHTVEITASNFPKNAYISSIAVNPENNKHLLVVFSNYNIQSIFESNNGGKDFINVSGNLEENPDGSGSGPSIRWVEIIPKITGNLYLVGTSIGLYKTENFHRENTIWMKESPTLIGSAVITMMDYRSNDGRLVVATHGNGIFDAQIPDFKAINQAEFGEGFKILKAYPNPFSDNTQIHFTIPEDGEVRIDIFSQKGDLINTILWAPQYAGSNIAVWDGATSLRQPLANGIYLYRIQYNGQVRAGRLILRR